MSERQYFVNVDGTNVASYMTLETTMILVEALYKKYYNEPAMFVEIGIHSEELAETVITAKS